MGKKAHVSCNLFPRGKNVPYLLYSLDILWVSSLDTTHRSVSLFLKVSQILLYGYIRIYLSPFPALDIGVSFFFFFYKQQSNAQPLMVAIVAAFYQTQLHHYHHTMACPYFNLQWLWVLGTVLIPIIQMKQRHFQRDNLLEVKMWSQAVWLQSFCL